MSNWIDLDADFGLPYKIFVFGLRSRFGMAILQRYRDGLDKDPLAMSLALRAIVEEARPSLTRPGLAVAWMVLDHRRNSIGVTCTHPEFPRVALMGRPEEERLELCPTCGNPLPLDTTYLIQRDGVVYEVCSRECDPKHTSCSPAIVEG